MSKIDSLNLYEQLVHELGDRSARGVHLVHFGPLAAQFSLPDGSAAVLIRHDSKQPELFVKTWEQIHARHVQGRLQVVAVGGEARDDGPRELMRRSLPSVQLGKQLQVFAIDESGAIWAGPRSRASRDLQASLDAVRRSPGQARIGSDAFRSWLGEQEQAAQATREAVQRYQASLASRRPTATTVLAVSIAAVFLLELLWGATDSLATMVKMGAVVSEGPEALAPWRILACSFLHGGIYHLAGNLVVLWLIGGFLERLIGPWRLLALWTLSVAGGSAAALLFSEATVMVGASGGGWGLMCAAGVLSIRPQGLIPDVMAAPLRRNVGQVLLLNLGISFLPGIALSAHLGGGLAGAALTAIGLSTLGLRSVDETARSARAPGGRGPAFAVGVLAAALLWGSIGLAIFDGQPWLKGSQGPWTIHELGESSYSLELPATLGELRSTTLDPLTTEYRSADNLGQPWTVTVRVSRSESKALTSLRLFREFRTLKKVLLEDELPEGFERSGEPSESEVPQMFTLDESFRGTQGDRAWRQARLVPDGAMVVTIAAQAQAVADGDLIHERVFSSIRTGYEVEAEPADSPEPSPSEGAEAPQ